MGATTTTTSSSSSVSSLPPTTALLEKPQKGQVPDEKNLKIEEKETEKEQEKEKESMKQLVDVSKIDADFVLDIRYSTMNNFTNSCIYDTKTPSHQNQAFLIREVALALSQANQEFRSRFGVQIKIWDAYRPFRYQQRLYDLASDKKYVADPAKGSIHNRGC